MGQLTPAEQQLARQLQAKKRTPPQILLVLAGRRRKAKKVGPRSRKNFGPDVTTVRRFLRGKTHKPNAEERRGRPRIFNRRAVLVGALVCLELLRATVFLGGGSPRPLVACSMGRCMVEFLLWQGRHRLSGCVDSLPAGLPKTAQLSTFGKND